MRYARCTSRTLNYCATRHLSARYRTIGTDNCEFYKRSGYVQQTSNETQQHDVTLKPQRTRQVARHVVFECAKLLTCQLKKNISRVTRRGVFTWRHESRAGYRRQVAHPRPAQLNCEMRTSPREEKTRVYTVNMRNTYVAMFVCRLRLLNALYIRVHIYLNLLNLFFGAGPDRSRRCWCLVTEKTRLRLLKYL